MIDAAPVTGGQLTALYPVKPVHDVPGSGGKTAAEIVQQLVLETELLTKPTYHLGEKVLGLERIEEDNLIKITSDEDHYGRTVVLALGKGTSTPIKLDKEITYNPAFDGDCLDYNVKNLEKSQQTKLYSLWGAEIRLWIGCQSDCKNCEKGNTNSPSQ